MADFNNNYTTINNCTSASAWNTNGTGRSVFVDSNVPTVDSQKGSSNVIRLESSNTGVVSWYLNLTGAQQFDVTERDFVLWFYYLKGKDAQYLKDAESSLKIRFYYNSGTSNWLEWQMGGNNSVRFGWNCIKVSGYSSWRDETELSNASASGGTKTYNNYSTYSGDVTRMDIICDFENANYKTEWGTNYQVPFACDHIRHGTHIIVGGGSEVSPLTVGDTSSGLVKYNNDYGLGVVKKNGQFLKLDCGLKIGDNTTSNSAGTTLTGHFKVEDFFVLNNQLSDGVKHTWEILNSSTLRIGEKDTSGTNDYAIKGCQIVVPTGRFPDFTCASGCKLKLYNSKLYRWNDISLDGTVDILVADLEYNENVELKSTSIDIENTEIHHNAQQSQNHCGSVTAQPNTFNDVKIHHCKEGLDFNASSLSISNYWAKDNTDYDLKSHQALTLINSTFDEDKIAEVT